MPRSKDLTVTWSGGDAEKQIIAVVGASIDVVSGVLGSFICTERAAAVSFTVPSYVLSAIPAGRSTGGDYPAGLLAVGAQPVPAVAKFSAGVLDLGYLQYTVQQVKSVTFR